MFVYLGNGRITEMDDDRPRILFHFHFKMTKQNFIVILKTYLKKMSFSSKFELLKYKIIIKYWILYTIQENEILL